MKAKKNSYIIKSGDDAVSFFTKRNLILERAKQEGILSYLLATNEDAILSINEIQADSRTDLQIYIDALKVQIDDHQTIIKRELTDRVTAEPLSIYEMCIGIHGNNHPTIDELIDARESVFIPEQAIKDLFRKNNIIVPRTAVQWEAAVSTILPHNYYCPWKGDEDQRLQSVHTPYINPMRYFMVIQVEVERSPRIQHYSFRDDTTIELVSAKLNNSSLIKAREDCQHNKINLSKQIKRADEHNGKILQFFKDAVEGISLSEASDLLRNMQWHLVLSKLTEVYTRQLTQQSSQVFHCMLMNLKLRDNQTLQHLYEQAKLMVANHQEVNQLLEAKTRADKIHTYLSSEECKEIIDLTDAEFELKHPNTRTFLVSNAIVDCLINSCSHDGCRLQEATIKFRLEHDKFPQSTKQFFASMVSEENIMPENKKVRVNTYVVESNYVKPDSNNNKKKNNDDSNTKFHCPYHIYNNNSNHNESDCYIIKKGLTKIDPSNNKWHVLKESGLHYRQDNKATTSNNLVPIQGSKVGPCTKCKNNNKPERIYKSHNTEDCRLSSKGITNTNKSIEGSNKDIGTMISSLQKSMKKITNHVESNNKTSSKTLSKKRKHQKVSKSKDAEESSASDSESS